MIDLLPACFRGKPQRIEQRLVNNVIKGAQILLLLAKPLLECLRSSATHRIIDFADS